ncbi:MAG: pantetheine-phosphate adenylyltransferase [Candidatus Izemoplasmatales bacterium]|jgi:pantetheine-phosphate adenylyltransferase|nr:pantetheine-phosphate adenylyltransferase [bacterium]MDZ4197393.1 pantetheine-phosphate adenylyltransferase [Candidatus Izemoplasmatales bacterium]
MKIGYYPGSFDPITFGHLDIIERGAKLFDKLYISISVNPNKKTMFTPEERVQLVRDVIYYLPNVEVVTSSILTVEHCKMLGASHILRGLRAVTDYDYEFQITNFNRRLSSEIDTVFLMTEGQNSYLSSSSVRELAYFNGDVTPFVPLVVAEAIKQKIKNSTLR